MKRNIFLFMAIIATSAVQAQNIKYPKAEKDGTTDTYFGTTVADPYRWLENDTSAQTAAWVTAENEVTNAYLAKIPFRQKLQRRLTELSNYERLSAPRKRGGKWYFSKNDGLQNQYVLYVMDELGGTPRVFLDPNKLSDDGTVALKSVSFSNNGRWAAYSISRSGSDWEEFFVIDLKTGKLTEDHVEWAKFSEASWQGDGFFYSAYDAPEEGKEFSNVNEIHKIYYHKIGTPQSEDVLFYQNPAYPKRFYYLEINEEETVMYLYEGGDGAGNNLFVRDLRQPNSQFIQMTSNMDYQYSPIYTEGDKIYLFTNYGAPKGRIMTADLHHPGIGDWKELIPEQENPLGGLSVINKQLFLTFQKDVFDHSYIYSLDGKLIQEVKLPSVGSVGFVGDEKEPECFYSFTSFTQPGSIYQYDIKRNESKLYSIPTIKARLEDFVSEQVFFESKDGTRIPMSLTYKKGLKRNGKNPVYLYGYGGFNVALGANFSAMRIPFLENGGIYAQVNLRGGNMARIGISPEPRCRSRMYSMTSSPLQNGSSVKAILQKIR